MAGVITQLFGTGESECSVILLWTYSLASVSLTVWSTFFMWLVSWISQLSLKWLPHPGIADLQQIFNSERQLRVAQRRFDWHTL